jgi:signal transduction histidine kinase
MIALADDTIVTALHQERLRVARDLHDLVLQDLTAVLLQLRAASHSPCTDSLTGYLGQATSAAEQGLASARKLLRELRCERPATRNDSCVALAPVLHEAASCVPRSSAAAVLCEFSGGIEQPPSVCAELALVMREALSNALRHAQAREIVCELLPQRDAFELRVSDDGRGFLPGRRSGGYGLRGMSERAALLGGALAVHSVPGSGTIVRLRLPLAS